MHKEPAQADRSPTRRFKPTPEPKPAPQPSPKPTERAGPAPESIPAPPAPRPISNDEALKDPLVRSVIEVFAGEIKRVHPKNS